MVFYSEWKFVQCGELLPRRTENNRKQKTVSVKTVGIVVCGSSGRAETESHIEKQTIKSPFKL